MVIKIDWNEYKEFKRYSTKEDKLAILVDFMRSYYNINSPFDMYEIFSNDDIAQLLLERKNIQEAQDLEGYIFRRI